MKKILTTAAMALMMTACSEEYKEALIQTQAGQEITITATIDANDGSALTRAVADNETTITSGMAVNEEMAVLFSDGTSNLKRTATVKSVADGTATIEFTIPSTLADNTACTLVYPATAAKDDNTDVKTYAELFATQTGTLSADLDVRKGTATILNDGTTASLSAATKLAAQNAIVKFSLSDGTNALAATQFDIKDGSNNVLTTVTPASATSTFYVAMAPATASVFRFEATNATATYYYDKFGATLAAGTYYQSPMILNDMLHTPLTFEAIEDGTIQVTIPQEVELENPIVYTKNGVDTDDSYSFTDFEIEVAAGDIISFHSANAALGKEVRSAYKKTTIKPTNRCYIYGNVMSVIDDEGDFTTDKVISADLALYGLFEGAKKLESHPDKELILPATTLTKYCYSDLFSGCEALTKAPDLPAAELKKSCYDAMFWGCSSLTEAPVMSAKTLAPYCCQNMFYECISLVKAPDLLAETLVDRCYNGIFYGCSSLSYVKCLATNIDDSTDYMNGWLSGVSATGTLEVASGAAWAVAGTNGIPEGWTVTE